MEPHEEETVRQALKPLSLLLLAIGVLCLVPYLLMPLAYLNRLSPAGTKWISAWGDRSFIAAMALLLLPWVSIPVSALWVHRKTGSREASLRALAGGLKRYGVAFLALLAQLAAFAAAGASQWILAIPAAFGLFMSGYALWLLRRDRAAAS